MSGELINPNPIVKATERIYRRPTGRLDAEEIYDVIRDIEDPEYSYSLE